MSTTTIIKRTTPENIGAVSKTWKADTPQTDLSTSKYWPSRTTEDWSEINLFVHGDNYVNVSYYFSRALIDSLSDNEIFVNRANNSGYINLLINRDVWQITAVKDQSGADISFTAQVYYR